MLELRTLTLAMDLSSCKSVKNRKNSMGKALVDGLCASTSVYSCAVSSILPEDEIILIHTYMYINHNRGTLEGFCQSCHTKGIRDSLTVSSIEAGRCIACP